MQVDHALVQCLRAPRNAAASTAAGPRRPHRNTPQGPLSTYTPNCLDDCLPCPYEVAIQTQPYRGSGRAQRRMRLILWGIDNCFASVCNVLGPVLRKVRKAKAMLHISFAWGQTGLVAAAASMTHVSTWVSEWWSDLAFLACVACITCRCLASRSRSNTLVHAGSIQKRKKNRPVRAAHSAPPRRGLPRPLGACRRGRGPESSAPVCARHRAAGLRSAVRSPPRGPVKWTSVCRCPFLEALTKKLWAPPHPHWQQRPLVPCAPRFRGRASSVAAGCGPDADCSYAAELFDMKRACGVIWWTSDMMLPTKNRFNIEWRI